MPKKICNFNNCNNIIGYTEKYCEIHKKNVKDEKADRYKRYDEMRKDDKEWKFYRTREWKKLRAKVLGDYSYMDLFSYYVNNEIIEANTSHHIVEVRDDWNKRLDYNNQFPCSESTHNQIHKMYEKDKEGTQKLLYKLLDRAKREIVLQ